MYNKENDKLILSVEKIVSSFNEEKSEFKKYFIGNNKLVDAFLYKIDNIDVFCLDKDNFFVFNYDVRGMRDKLYHYQVKDYKVNLVKVLNDVVDIGFGDFFNEDLVDCTCSEGRMLYNYKTKEVIIPNFSLSYHDRISNVYKEIAKMKLVVEKLEKLASSLNGKNYDFSKYFVDNNLIDAFNLKIDNLEYEKKKQDQMKKQVKEVINDDKIIYFEELAVKSNKCLDECFENSIRVINFNNYYILWLCGISSLDVNYVFDKNGNLLFDNINIAGIDKNNFFVFSYDVKEMKDKLYHYQVNDSEINLVKVLDDVVDIDYCDFFVRDLVVCSCNEGSMLYNYKTKEVLIPSFSSMFKDVKNNELVRVVKKIYGIYDYRSSLVSKLEFLVDRNGEISSPVCDFETGYECNHLLSSYGDIQEEILNNVYKDASKMSKIYKRVKKQN